MDIIVGDTELEHLQSIYDEMDANGRKRMLYMAENLLNVQKMSYDENPENSKAKGEGKQ